jgi:mannose-1-phosphate guanylyltransferase
MILAAGLGTRLRPLTNELPKPLLPLGDRPVLAHVVAALQRAGLEGAVVNSHHLPELLSAFTATCPFILHTVHEPEIRGTAGGVAGARPFLGEGPLIVSNADLVSEPPVTALLEGARRSGFAMALAARPRGEGRVGLGADGRVVRLRDRSFGEEACGADYLSVAGLAADVVRALPERGCLVADVALPRLARGEPIEGVLVEGPWLSIGDGLGDYLEANQRWLAGAGRASFVAASARVGEGVALERSIVGEAAEVSGSGTVEGSVIWPGARAVAPLAGAVVTARGQVVR